MSDPIKAALVAATEALCALPMHAEHSEEAAAAVAAFLRALPTGSGRGLFEFGEDDSAQCLHLHEAAAAVERAAQEARDGG